MSTDDWEKTAFISQLGKLQFKRMPFGLKKRLQLSEVS